MVEMLTNDLFAKVKEGLPKEADITDIRFEGSDIVVYTKSKEFFTGDTTAVKELVSVMKKRIVLRPDQKICKDMEDAKKEIEKIVPKEAGLKDIEFEPGFSTVTIEAEKPGLVIGKGGELIRELRAKTLWAPVIKRAPAIHSDTIKTLRELIYSESAFRRVFLDKVGRRIHSGWKPTDWITVTGLGAFREVGRSAVLVRTPESKVLLDCGVKPGGSMDFPMLALPESDPTKLDAVVLSHAHMDHTGMIPFLYEMGCEAPLYCTAPTRDLMVLMCLDFIEIAQREGKPAPYTTKGIKEAVKRCITLELGQVADITPDIRLTLLNDGHILGGSLIHLHIGNGLHNILYSLDWRCPVTLIDPKDNVHIVEIGKFIDEYFKRCATKSEGFVESAPNLEGWRTVAFDPKTYQAKIVEVTQFLRHPISEDLYEVKTETGKDVIVSGSHSLFAAMGGKVFASEVKNLKEGNWIVGTREIPFEPKEPIVDLFEYRNKIRISIDEDKILKNILDSFEESLGKIKNKDEVRNWLIDHLKYGLYKYDIARKYKVSPKRVIKVFDKLGIKSHPRVGCKLPQRIKITPDFARFLGYYISEGSSSKNTLQITNYNKEILEDAKNIIKNTFGIEGDLRRKDKVTLFYSKQLKLFLLDVLKCGHNAHEKRIPKEILSAPKEVFSEFLRGYMLGDGTKSMRENSPQISATSKSKFLIQDLGFLFLRMGIPANFQFNKYTKMYNVLIYGKEKVNRFFENVNLDSWKELVAPEVRGSKSSYSERIPIESLTPEMQMALSKTSYQEAISCGISKLQKMDLSEPDLKLVKSCFTFERIKSIKKVNPTSKYVYDFQVEGFENFLGGNGFLFMHNTADLKFDRTALFDPATTDFARAETIITESTYGAPDALQPRRSEAEASLANAVKKTIERGGKALIPSFAVERAQDAMVILERAGLNCTVYLDGMVWDATAIHTAYPEYFGRELQREILQKGHNPLVAPMFKRIGSQEERKKILESKEPCAIIATSGMLIGGPSVWWLRNLAEDKKNSLIFIGYQAEGSMGRKILRGWREVPIEESGKTKALAINLEVSMIEGLSGHSDYKQLINYIVRMNQKPQYIITNHGEESRCLALAQNLHKLYGVETIAPKILETVRLV